MQTIGFLNRETQQHKAENTLRLVIPIADGLGLIEIRLVETLLRSCSAGAAVTAGPVVVWVRVSP